MASYGHSYGGPNANSDSSDSYTDSDAMSVRTSSERGSQGMDLDSARGCSPAPSIYSYHPSIDGNALREIHGRYFNSQNETYMLPADDAERGRLGLQHDALTLAIGSLYQNRAAVREVLAPRPGPPPSIIDIGCGTGTWCVAMAKEFPHCEVVGIDLAPPQPGEPIPPNCRFEIDDANLGFAHFYNCFDVVNTRAITAGIVDYPYFLRECSRILKPGGVMLFADGDLQLYDENFEGLTVCEEGEPGYSWLQRIFFASYNSMKNRGAQIDGMTLTPRWLREIPDFEEVGTQDVYIPVGSWLKGNPRVELISDLVQRDASLVIRGMKPMLMSEGYFSETVDKFIEEALQEMEELTCRIYSVWHFSWARKSLLPTLPDEQTLAERAHAPARSSPQLTAAQVLAPSGATPGSAPIYPPAPTPSNQAVPPPSTRPHVNNTPAPGGCRPIVPHAPSRYDNYQHQPDPFASFDYNSYQSQHPAQAHHDATQSGGHPAPSSHMQPEIFGPYWAEAQAQAQTLALQRQQQEAAMWQHHQHLVQQQAANYDAALAAHLQQQLHLQDHHQPTHNEAGPSNYAYRG